MASLAEYLSVQISALLRASNFLTFRQLQSVDLLWMCMWYDKSTFLVCFNFPFILLKWCHYYLTRLVRGVVCSYDINTLLYPIRFSQSHHDLKDYLRKTGKTMDNLSNEGTCTKFCLKSTKWVLVTSGRFIIEGNLCPRTGSAPFPQMSSKNFRRLECNLSPHNGGSKFFKNIATSTSDRVLQLQKYLFTILQLLKSESCKKKKKKKKKKRKAKLSFMANMTSLFQLLTWFCFPRQG